MRLPARTPHVLLALIVCILFAFASSSCAPMANALGLATLEDLNGKSAELQTFAKKAADESAAAALAQSQESFVQAFAPLEALFPGIREQARALFSGRPYIPPNAPAPVPPTLVRDPIPGQEPATPWVPILGTAGVLATAVAEALRRSRKAAVEEAAAKVNAQRDANRVARHEAVTPAEATAKGYHLDGQARPTA